MSVRQQKEWTLYVCPKCENAELRDTMKHRFGMAGYSCRCGHTPMTQVTVVEKPA